MGFFEFEIVIWVVGGWELVVLFFMFGIVCDGSLVVVFIGIWELICLRYVNLGCDEFVEVICFVEGDIGVFVFLWLLLKLEVFGVVMKDDGFEVVSGIGEWIEFGCKLMILFDGLNVCLGWVDGLLIGEGVIGEVIVLGWDELILVNGCV